MIIDFQNIGTGIVCAAVVKDVTKAWKTKILIAKTKFTWEGINVQVYKNVTHR